MLRADQAAEPPHYGPTHGESNTLAETSAFVSHFFAYFQRLSRSVSQLLPNVAKSKQPSIGPACEGEGSAALWQVIVEVVLTQLPILKL
jgi:hypothetical protein